MIAAARVPLLSDPAKSQFLRPSAQGRIADQLNLLDLQEVTRMLAGPATHNAP